MLRQFSHLSHMLKYRVGVSADLVDIHPFSLDLFLRSDEGSSAAGFGNGDIVHDKKSN